MPASTTITAFYTFAPNTKAKATQVNANFANFRGNLIPIEPLTITASDSVYDLGSDEHKWKTLHANNFNPAYSTNTAQLAYSSATEFTLGAFVMVKQSVRLASVWSDNIGVDFVMADDPQHGAWIRVNANGLATSTVFHHSLKVRPFSTDGTSTGPAALIQSSSFNTGLATITVTAVPGTTITVASVGNIWELGICGLSNGFGYLRLNEISTTTSGVVTLSGELYICRNTVTSQVVGMQHQGSTWDITTTAGKVTRNDQTFLGHMGFDTGLTTGSNTYFLAVKSGQANTNITIAGRLWAKELL